MFLGEMAGRVTQAAEAQEDPGLELCQEEGQC